MARATSGPYSADPNDEVWGVGEAFWFGLLGYGSKHRLPRNCSEGSAHVLKAERLAMQSHQVPALARTIGNVYTACRSSIMTVAIPPKACSEIYSSHNTLYTPVSLFRHEA